MSCHRAAGPRAARLRALPTGEAKTAGGYVPSCGERRWSFHPSLLTSACSSFTWAGSGFPAVGGAGAWAACGGGEPRLGEGKLWDASSSARDGEASSRGARAPVSLETQYMTPSLRSLCWRGQFSTLWSPPQGEPFVLRTGHRWVRGQLLFEQPRPLM